MTTPTQPFEWRLRVGYSECDMQGHVFNAHYFTWMDTAHLEFLRATVGPHSDLVAAGADYVVAEESARFRGAARFDDFIVIEVTLDPIGASSMTSRYRMRRDEQVLVEGSVRHVCVDSTTYTKRAWPDHVREALAPYVNPAGAPDS